MSLHNTLPRHYWKKKMTPPPFPPITKPSQKIGTDSRVKIPSFQSWLLTNIRSLSWILWKNAHYWLSIFAFFSCLLPSSSFHQWSFPLFISLTPLHTLYFLMFLQSISSSLPLNICSDCNSGLVSVKMTDISTTWTGIITRVNCEDQYFASH